MYCIVALLHCSALLIYFEEYSKVRKEIEELSLKEKTLKELLLEEFDKVSKKPTYQNEFGKFVKKKMSKWIYSESFYKTENSVKEKIKQLSEPLLEEIELIKEKEQSDGVAKVEETFTLAFQPNK
jgi:hypothetical protein